MKTRVSDDRSQRMPAVMLTSILSLAAGSAALAQPPPPPIAIVDDLPADVLSPDEWRRVDAALERALRWLAAQQQRDGSFPTLPTGQPGVTSLSMMAFVAHGHVPGDRPHGKRLERGIDFVLSCQKENGLITLLGPDGPGILAMSNTKSALVPLTTTQLAHCRSASCTACAATIGLIVCTAVEKAIAASLKIQHC